MLEAAAPPTKAEAAAQGRAMRCALWATLAVAVLWTAIPALVIGNLHTDTLEAIYWGADWALGYGKHPPITTWLLDGTLALGLPPIASILAMSQATVAIAAYFVWRSARLFRGPATAALAVCLFLASLATTLYAVQANHNSVLAPFWAASAFFGLRYLERRRLADSLALGAAAGLGLVAKYEILFILATLAIIAAAVPRYRDVFAARRSYASIVLMLLIAAPHVWWLAHHGWPSVERAVGGDKATTLRTISLSGADALVGQIALLGPAALLLSILSPWRAERPRARSDGGARLGLWLVVLPSLILILGAAATDQVVKPLWALPLTSSAAVGLALMFPAKENEARAPVAFALTALAGSLVLLGSFFAYLLTADALGKPLTAYEPQARVLATAVEQEWRRRQPGPLECLVVADRKLGPAPLLWLRPMPHVVDYSSGFWHGPRKVAGCLATGGMIADASPNHDAERLFPRSCPADSRRVSVPAAFGFKGGSWPVDLVYVPPPGQGCG